MTPQQSRLIARAKDSLTAAVLLKANGHHAIAVSRAYYAMFYVAKAMLLGEGVATNKHSGVISLFSQLFIKPGRVPVEQIQRAEKFIAMGEKYFISTSPSSSSEPPSDER